MDVDVDVDVVLIYYSHNPPFSSGRFSSRPRQGFPPREEPSSDPSIIYRLSSSPDPHDSDGDREGMRTRRGFSYGACEGVCSDVGAAVVVKKSTRQRREEETGFAGCKRQRRAADRFDALPDDLVLSILSKLSATARRPSDFISVLLTIRQPGGFFHSRHDPFLLFAEPRERSFSYGEGGDWVPCACDVLACGHPVQRERWFEERQGLAGWGCALCARRLPWPRRRHEGARPLPPGRLWRPSEHRRGPPVPCPGQRTGARGRPVDILGGSLSLSPVVARVGAALGLRAPPPGRRRVSSAERFRVQRPSLRGAPGEPVPGRVVLRPRRITWARAEDVLSRGLREAGDAEARVQKVLCLRNRQLLLACLPGARLEAPAQDGVRGVGAVGGRWCRPRQGKRRCWRRRRPRRRVGELTGVGTVEAGPVRLPFFRGTKMENIYKKSG
ncbi:hypothetical protein SAY87_019410 [Trapa incisa]|uniref:Uncharacterized protein n=1 Tax=Trapa incisa TaxID=236973 RepID=A0AAN7K296_9MYRT|nr:hypothetical protein SAY87_019410 [Trapa incisa]